MARMLRNTFLGGKRPCYCCNGTVYSGRAKEDEAVRREIEEAWDWLESERYPEPVGGYSCCKDCG